MSFSFKGLTPWMRDFGMPIKRLGVDDFIEFLLTEMKKNGKSIKVRIEY
jgi:hypothetical protein